MTEKKKPQNKQTPSTKTPSAKPQVLKLKKKGASTTSEEAEAKVESPKSKTTKSKTTQNRKPEPESKSSEGQKSAEGGGFRFGFGKMKELSEAFKKAQEIQEGAKQLQQELEVMRIEATSEDDSVTYTVSGNQEPIAISIKIVDGKTAEELSHSVLEAMQKGYLMSTENMRARMEKLTGSLNLPTLEDLSE